MRNNGSGLRHMVMFRFKDGISAEQIAAIAKNFVELKNKIPGILDFEWGRDVSVEGKSQGFTHIFLATFASETARDDYLPHDAHRAFQLATRPFVEKAVVLDYWPAA